MIDTHCHLDMPQFDGDRDEVVARARAAGVTRILVPGVRPEAWDDMAELAAAHPDVLRISVGIHPQVVYDLCPGERLEAHRLGDAVHRLGAVAIGECGLDAPSPDREAQEDLFRRHVGAARELGLPLVVHVMKAHDAALRILREEKTAGGVMHSYSGSAELVPVYADLGFAFSFAGPVSYGNARRPVAAARAVPDDLLLAETDAPDQAPTPHRGQRSEPAYITHIIEALARIRDTTPEAMAALTTRNAERVLRLRA